MQAATSDRAGRRLLAAGLLTFALALPASAKTMMEYGNMPMRQPQSEDLQPVQEPVGAGESQLRSVQESDRRLRVAEPPLTVPGFDNDYDDADANSPQRTGIHSFYWLLGALALVAAVTLVYTLGQRRRVPDTGRR